MTRCARCDWQPEGDDPPREQLAEHALAAGHPLCAVGAESLRPDETQTCERCLGRTQELLAGIAIMYDELPSHLGQPRGQALGGQRGGADGRPLPGGDVLVLLGPGSQGLAEDATTTREGDATSVAFELGFWEREWRETRGELGSVRACSNRAVVRAAVGYLETRMRWAANNHLGFDEFAADLRQLHARLERSTGRVRKPAKAGASCFDCGGDLIRPLTDEGLEVEDVVVCQTCRASYDGARYLLALRAGVEGSQGWVRLTDAATFARRPVKTIRSWVERLHVAAVCDVEKRSVLVWWPDLRARLQPSATRQQRSA